MKLAIVAEYDPSFFRNLRQPDVIWGIVFELKFVFWIVMVLNGKTPRLRRPDCFRKTLAKVSIKIKS